jgi:hypothetical protein
MKAGPDEAQTASPYPSPGASKSELAAVIPVKWLPQQANPIAQINVRRACPARRKTLDKLQTADGFELLRGSLHGSLRGSWTIRGLYPNGQYPAAPQDTLPQVTYRQEWICRS